MTRPPLFVHGLQHPVILLDRHIEIGHAAYALEISADAPSFAGLDVMNLRLRLEQFAAFRRMDGNRDLTFHKGKY